MLTENTVTKLQEMKITAMARAFKEQLTDPNINGLAFEDRFGLLVDQEWTSRKNNHLKRLIKQAKFSETGACVEDIEYHSDRNLDSAQIARLASCNYITERHNILLLGATGSGKTYLACALGMAAVRNFLSVRYGYLVAVVLGNVPVVAHDIALSIGREEGHTRSTGVLDARVQPKGGLSDACRTDHEDMDISRVYKGGGAVLAALAPDHNALRQSFLGRQHFKTVLFADKLRNGWFLTVFCLPAPLLWSERNVAVGLSDLCFICPPRRTVLTVAHGFALDIVEVIDMGNQRDAAQHRKHHGGDGD